jgi:hypothetical protein
MKIKVLVAASWFGHLHDGLLVDLARLGDIEHGLKDDQAAVHVSRVVLHKLERIVRMLLTHILIHVAISAQVALGKES